MISYWKQFMDFCVERKVTESATALETSFENGDIFEECPRWIAIWIMTK